MTDDRVSLSLALVQLLGSAATYNDKGFHWMQHDAAQVREMQREYHDELRALAARIGPDVLGSELAASIESGAAARDDVGLYVGLAEQVLGVRRQPVA